MRYLDAQDILRTSNHHHLATNGLHLSPLQNEEPTDRNTKKITRVYMHVHVSMNKFSKVLLALLALPPLWVHPRKTQNLLLTMLFNHPPVFRIRHYGISHQPEAT